MEGLTDTVMPVSLLLVGFGIVVGAVVGSIHSVLLAANTHFDMCVPLDKVQLMKMKPVGKRNRSTKADVQSDQKHQCQHHRAVFNSCSHSPQLDMLSTLETLLTEFLTEQTRRPETSCFRVMLLVS